MKKTLKLVASAALLTALSVPATACSFLTAKNVEKISPLSEYTQSYSVSLKQSDFTVNTKKSNIEFLRSDGAGTVVVKETKNEDGDYIVTYRLFNLATASFVGGIQSEEELHVLDKGLFYSVKTTDTEGDPLDVDEYTYTLYSATSTLTSNVKGTVDNYNCIFTQENGTRWYVDYNGTVQQESNPFAMLFTDYDLKIGKKYIESQDSYEFLIYNEDGEFEKAFNAYSELNLSANSRIRTGWIAGDTLFVQVETALPESAEKYDYTASTGSGIQKFDLATYSYSVKSDKLSEVKNFDYYVEDSYAGYGLKLDYAILNVHKIVDQQISEMEILQSFDDKGNIYFDIQKLVPGAEDIDYCGDYVLIEDSIGMTYVYKEKELVMTIPADSVDFSYTDSNKIYYTIGTMLYIYDIDSQSVAKSVANVSETGTTQQGNIWYAVYDDSNQTTQYNVYNVETGAVTLEKTINADKQSMYSGSFDSVYCMVSSMTDDGMTYTLSFPDSSINEITSKVGIERVQSYSTYSNDGMSYTRYIIFCVKSKNSDKDTINSYYVLTESETISEKE